jgi:hypothetical protein
MVLIILATLFCSVFGPSSSAWASGGTGYGEFSLSQWQDSLNINTVGQASTRVLEEPIGICPGAGYRDPISSNWAWDINGCVFFGTADVHVDNTSGATLSYSSKNNAVYGIESGFGFLWSPAGIKHQIGIGIPVLIRHTNLNTTTAGASFSSTTAVQTGLEIDYRFYSTHGFCFDPKLAWFQTSHTGLWSINFGTDF